MKETIRHLILLLALCATTTLSAQVVIGGVEDYDVDYLTPKTYEIGGITIENADRLDKRMVLLVAGLQVGDVVKIPGDKISNAVDNLWQQGLFEDVKILLTRIHDDKVFLKIVLVERPRLLAYSLRGISKNDKKKITEKLDLRTGEVVTENIIRSSCNKIKGYYAEKGFTNVTVEPTTSPDSSGERMIVSFNVKKGKRVKIDSIIIEGNEKVPTGKLLSKMKNTHDVNYKKRMYVWTPGFWKRSKYREAQFEEDLNSVIAYYNELGYRDARILKDTVWNVDVNESTTMSDKQKKKQDRVKVKVKVHEGDPFYFRNISFSGNTIYSSEELSKHLRISKGDPYNKTLLETNLTYNPSGTDIYSMYMDNGYLFFNAVPVETAVNGDSIDLEIRIVEGKQARIRNVVVEGNTVTNDKVVMRELHTRPGDLFSRDAVLRSRRELLTLGYFEESTLIPEPRPNRDDGTVDIVYKVEEKTTSQLTLQGGFGKDIVYGTVGVNLTNFSARRVFDGNAWKPLPLGDGQHLGINATSNGANYYAVGVNFMEPWLGGKRPQTLSVSFNHSLYSNGYWVKDKTSSKYYSLRMSGVAVSTSRRLKWPDDYFILSQSLCYRHYGLTNYSINTVYSNGKTNEVVYSVGLSRNSLDAPIYPRTGSEVSVTAFLTPPYSLLSGKDYSTLSAQDKYKWLEYFKFNLKGSWMLNVVGDLVVNARFRFGFMGYYNKQIGLSPFGRYFLGGDGLQSIAFDGREIIPLRGYKNNSLSPQDGASVFDRYTLELRHPIVENPGTTIYALAFLEGGNSWTNFKEFQPFKIYNAAGLGVRLYLPMIGLMGFDWGYGFDGTNGGSQFHFIIGQSID